jgi:hypothetical protein
MEGKKKVHSMEKKCHSSTVPLPQYKDRVAIVILMLYAPEKVCCVPIRFLCNICGRDLVVLKNI